MSSVYYINKGVNKTLEFRGLKAQYIIYLAIGILILLIAFAIMYIIGIPVYISLAVIAGSGFFLYTKVMTYSKKYGEHGLMKTTASKKLPHALICRSRRTFLRLKS